MVKRALENEDFDRAAWKGGNALSVLGLRCLWRRSRLFDQALQDAYRESLNARFKCDSLFAVITV